MNPLPSRKIALHVLLGAALFAGAALVTWNIYDRVQARAQVAQLSADAKAQQMALKYLYAHAGNQPALISALSGELKKIPPPLAMESLRVTFLSCAKAQNLQPQLVETVETFLPQLENFDDHLRLFLQLENAALASQKTLFHPSLHAFEASLAKLVASEVEKQSPENALRLIALFERTEAKHPAVAAGLQAYKQQLEKAEGDAFLKRVALLNEQGQWSTELIAPPLYNRWLVALSNAAGEDTRALAVTFICARPQAGAYPELGDALLHLTQDPSAQVRHEVLHAATQWVKGGGTTLNQAFLNAIKAATKDSDTRISREAWIALGLLNAPMDIPETLEKIPSSVAEAAFATLAKSHAQDESFAARMEALLQSNDALALFATYALTQCDHPKAKQALAHLLDNFNSSDTLRQLCAWRAVLASTPVQARAFLLKKDLPAPLMDAAAFASQTLPENLITTLQDEKACRHRLAALEGLPAASATFQTPDEDWGLVFLALAKAEKDSGKIVAHLRPLFLSKDSIWRDCACVVASQRLSQAQITELARDLLATYGVEAKTSGALLCGLAKVYPLRIQGGSSTFLLKHPEWTETSLYAQSNEVLAKLGLATLDALTDNANRWRDGKSPQDQSIFIASEIGLALRGDLRGNKPMAPSSFLFDKRIPYSTVLLAMLQENKTEAFEVLLGDNTRLPFVPRQLLSTARFGEVLNAFLPPDAPRISYWADVHLQLLQFESLKVWWRLNKIQHP